MCSGRFFRLEEMTSQSVILDFRVQFVDVVSQTKQKNLSFHFGFPTKEKSLKLIVVFQNAEGSFYLNRPIDPISYSCLGKDVFV